MDYCVKPATKHECNTFYIGSILPSILGTVGGIVSAIFSFISITVIWRSQVRLSSIYHRIMFMMSMMDIVNSVAISLSTLPMPSDGIYPFNGTSIGNIATCEAQAFAHIAGTGGSFFYICGLSFFYLCLIQIRMSDKCIRRCIEPCIHLFGFVIPLINAVSKSAEKILSFYSYRGYTTCYTMLYQYI